MAGRPSHAGLRHLALNVRDLPAMRAFYVDLLGFAVEWEPDADNVYLSSGLDNLALHRLPAEGGHQSGAPEGGSPRAVRPDDGSGPSPLDHLGLIVRRAEDVDAWAAFLTAHGVGLDAQPRTHRDGARSCYFRDPDGNRVQIIHHPPISGKV